MEKDVEAENEMDELKEREVVNGMVGVAVIVEEGVGVTDVEMLKERVGVSATVGVPVGVDDGVTEMDDETVSL